MTKVFDKHIEKILKEARRCCIFAEKNLRQVRKDEIFQSWKKKEANKMIELGTLIANEKNYEKEKKN